MHDLRPMLRTLAALLIAPAFALHAQTDALAYLEAARQAYATKDYPTAEAMADSALKRDGKLPGGHKLRGDIRQKQGNLHGALLDYVKAEKLDRNDARLYISRSAIHITEGRLSDAMKDLDKARKLTPNDPDLWYNRACANYLGQNNEGALRDLDHCLKLRPGNPDALFLRGVVKGELYREEEGLEDIQAALQLDPKVSGGRMSAAILLFELERYDEAIAAFTVLIDERAPELKEALYYRADCHYKLGDKGSACVDWRRCGELGDADAQVIVRNYCLTDAEKIPKKPVKKKKLVIEF
jgi:tetratricopeptide (TPR) repeat protein